MIDGNVDNNDPADYRWPRKRWIDKFDDERYQAAFDISEEARLDYINMIERKYGNVKSE